MTWQAQAEAHAAAVAPAEACGLLVLRRGRLRFVAAENMAPDQLLGFEISAEAFADAACLGDVVAVVHSHPGASSAPGPMDIEEQAASGLDWWILGADGWRCLTAGPRYTGRAWDYGRADCFELARDWYWRERGLWIPTREEMAPGHDHTDGWWLRGADLYSQFFLPPPGFGLAGGGPAPGDLLLMRVGAPVPNHLGIVQPDGKILHHLAGRLSCIETLDRFYRERIAHVLRPAAAPHDPPPG